MSLLVVKLKNCVLDVLTASYPEHSFSIDQITVNETKAEFEGEYTVVLFPFVKLLKYKIVFLSIIYKVVFCKRQPCQAVPSE